MHQIFPVTGPELEIVPLATAGALPAGVRHVADLYGNESAPATLDRPWLRANMIASADGAAALDGRSGGLGGPADRMVFTVLRSLADVILVGAGTARAEHYGPAAPDTVWAALRAGRSPAPAIAVVSNSLHLDARARLFTEAPPDARTIVLTAASAPAERLAALRESARVLMVGQHRVDADAAVTALAGLGYRQILVEGGPHLLRALAEAGLIDELCLTTSPMLAGGAAGRIVPRTDEFSAALPASLTLAHVLTDNGFLIARYVRSAAGSTGSH